MSSLFTYIYRILKQRRIVFFILFICAIAFSGFFASQITLEEDITKMMPSDAKVAKLNAIFKNSKFLDRLVVTVSLADTTALSEPETLIEFTDSIVNAAKSLQPNLSRARLRKNIGRRTVCRKSLFWDVRTSENLR